MRSKFQQTTFTLTIQFANGTITTIPIQFCSFGTDNSSKLNKFESTIKKHLYVHFR